MKFHDFSMTRSPSFQNTVLQCLFHDFSTILALFPNSMNFPGLGTLTLVPRWWPHYVPKTMGYDIIYSQEVLQWQHLEVVQLGRMLLQDSVGCEVLWYWWDHLHWRDLSLEATSLYLEFHNRAALRKKVPKGPSFGMTPTFQKKKNK